MNTIFHFTLLFPNVSSFCSDSATEQEIEQDIIKSVDDEVKETAPFAPKPVADAVGDDVLHETNDKFQRLNLFFEQDRVSWMRNIRYSSLIEILQK